MATETEISTGLYIKAHDPVLQDEMVEEGFWTKLTADTSESEYADTVNEAVVKKQSSLLRPGDEFIQFGFSEQLEGEGVWNGATLSGKEEKMITLENKTYFTDVRHGVPFPLKGIKSWTNQAVNLLAQKRKRLAIWNAQVDEQQGWQALLKACPDKVNAAIGSNSPQYWHPLIFSTETAGLSQVTWAANQATYQASVATKLDALGTGDTVTYDRIVEASSAASTNKLEMCKFTVNGRTEYKWLWAYPRAARLRLKATLKDYFLNGDVRGPQNQALRGDKFMFENFMFVESAYIPRLTHTSNVLSLQEAWAYNTSTAKREDQRAITKGVVHAILGDGGLCLAEPEGLEFDTEDSDYKRRQGLATYRMFGYRRNEGYDVISAPTRILQQSSMILIENNA